MNEVDFSAVLDFLLHRGLTEGRSGIFSVKGSEVWTLYKDAAGRSSGAVQAGKVCISCREGGCWLGSGEWTRSHCDPARMM